MCTITNRIYKNLIQKTKNIFSLSESEIRCTDYNLIIKNPTYPVCDIILVSGRVYNVEYVLNYWNSVIPPEYNAVFILKHTGANISLSCFVTLEKDLVAKPLPNEITSPINFLNINDLVVLTLPGIERLKPSRGALLTKCSVQRSYNHNVFVVEFIVYGPSSESSFKELMHDISGKLERLPQMTHGVLSKNYRTTTSSSSLIHTNTSRTWQKKHEIVKPTIYCSGGPAQKEPAPIAVVPSTAVSKHQLWHYGRYVMMGCAWLTLVALTGLVYKSFFN
uniref:Docking/nuclear lamella protein n=1 Tax=Elephant endotheliotropic herpesvirus 1A TaxID=759753 RepID=A0A866VTF7_ELHV1|nr:docking/nuclear lamella protein [Elephant endotheliotropic herpesvirus 1A]QOE74700.1 docking/nuclear lamella protein [Elephant endotheliotropic herpesvirus 1A]